MTSRAKRPASAGHPRPIVSVSPPKPTARITHSSGVGQYRRNAQSAAAYGPHGLNAVANPANHIHVLIIVLQAFGENA